VGYAHHVGQNPTYDPTIKTAGGCPAASYFLLLRQKESNPRKGDPGLSPPSGVPSIRHKQAGLRNSHDPLRVHVLKHNQRLGWRRLPV
jgi:hypothetical protein